MQAGQYETTYTLADLEVDVMGYYSPAEKATGPTYDCGGTPGCGADFEIENVMHDGCDLLPVLSAFTVSCITEYVLGQIEDAEHE